MTKVDLRDNNEVEAIQEERNSQNGGSDRQGILRTNS